MITQTNNEIKREEKSFRVETTESINGRATSRRQKTPTLKRSRKWISETALATRGRGEEILHALGIDEIENALSKRKWHFPGGTSGKPQAKINDPERGPGQDDDTGVKWSDYVGLAKEVRGDASMGESAEYVAGVIGFEIPMVAPNEKACGKGTRDTPKSLKIQPFNAVSLAGYLKRLGYAGDALPGAVAKMKDAGIRIGEYRCKVATAPDRWESFRVIALPVWGSGGSAAAPVNWVVERLDGNALFAWTLNGDPDPGNHRPKRKCIGGKSRGILGDVRQVDALIAGILPAGLCIKTEGISDWVTAMLRDDKPENAMVWTNPFGCRDVRESWERERWSFDLFRDRDLWVVHDADKPGQFGAIGEARGDGKRTPGWCHRFAEAGARCKNVTLPFPEDANHGQDLRDFFIGGGTYKDLVDRAATAEPITTICSSDSTEPSRETITWTDEEKTLVQSSIRALAKSPDVFQRGGELFDVVNSNHPLNCNESVLRVRRMPLAHMRTELSSRARFVAESKTGDTYTKTITNSLVQQIDRFADYPGIRELWGVAEYPFLRPDGSVCTQSGYDATTKTYLKTSLRVGVPASPTRSDALASVGRLLDLVRDFEFKAEHHRSAWLAGLLTVFAKPAIRGCCPLFIVEASTQGAGKTRLVDLISTIAMGRSMTRNSWPSRDEEVAKIITAIVSSGIPTVLFDNCKTVLGGQALEALGTAETWKGRILGESRETAEMPIAQTFFFTGNNCSVTSDVARRGCFTRLEPSCENPDMRDDFTHADLLGHALKNRESLVADVLTILRAFRISGERREIKRWGGFEAWSELIRGAIAWLGLADPIEGTIDVKADTHAADVFPDLLEGLREAGFDDDTPLTSSQVHELMQTQNGYGEFVHRKLRDAILSACGDKKITTVRIGKLLKRYDGRILNENKFFAKRNENNVTSWNISTLDPRRSGGELGFGGLHESRFSEIDDSARKTNIERTPNHSETSRLPENCSPSCAKSDRVTKKEIDGEKIVCSRCGRFYGRVRS